VPLSDTRGQTALKVLIALSLAGCPMQPARQQMRGQHRQRQNPHKAKRRSSERLFVTAYLVQTNLAQLGIAPTTNRDPLRFGFFRNHSQQVDARQSVIDRDTAHLDMICQTEWTIQRMTSGPETNCIMQSRFLILLNGSSAVEH